MSDYSISWWNLENLFDLASSTSRPDWLASRLSSELEGWTATVLNRKVERLSEVIRAMNGGNGPDLLGVCEVENLPVLERLVNRIQADGGRSYAVVHHDTSDKRGIDVAFLYDSALFTAGEQFDHVILRRNATRDLFQVNFTTAAGNELIVIGNHWPSKSGGALESDPYRMMAGETIAYWHDRILDIKGKDAAILSMGDFNDAPFERSVTDYALATVSRTKVVRARTAPRAWNLSFPSVGEGIGTYYFNNYPDVIDQFWVSRGIATGSSGFRVGEDGSGHAGMNIFKYSPMVSEGAYPSPRRFGRPSSASTYDDTGYSDHFPIEMVIRES